MKRTGIFCLFTPSGSIDETVKYTLSELKNVINYLIIVVNGNINNARELSAYADVVLIRENFGFDIGAYKSVILSPNYKNLIKNSKELVLCNSSFYGPFISFQDIFEKMEKSDADFWGISSSEKNFVQHIQSYFIVFRNRIIKGEELFNYLQEKIDQSKIDYYGACSIFENGLFGFLKKSGYKFDAYKRNIDCNNYSNPYGSVKIDGLPVLKKKIFSKEFYEMKRIIDALSYIREQYRYDVNLILDHAYSNYGIKISEAQLNSNKMGDAKKDIFQNPEMISREEIEEFVESEKEIFIYGNGKMAKHIYSCFFFYENNPRLKGFIVSDDQSIMQRNYRGYPVNHISELDGLSGKAILVAMNIENTKNIIKDIDIKSNIKVLWKGLSLA